MLYREIPMIQYTDTVHDVIPKLESVYNHVRENCGL